MALARKCDRCNEYYIPDYAIIVDKHINAIAIIDRNWDNNYYVNKCFDLCPSCLNSFVNWLKRENHESNN